MAQELTISMLAEYEDAVGVKGNVEIANLIITLATARLAHTKQNVGTSEEIINLGSFTADSTSLGVLILRNLDPINYIEVRVGTGSTKFAKLFPKGSVGGLNFCVLQVGSGVTAPYVIANSAACEMEIFLCAL